jgi:hypothetical protein
MKQLILLVFVVSSGMTACDVDLVGSGKPNPPATQILKAYADPDTVAVGEMTTLYVVIRDSTESGFDFSWRGFGSVVHTTLPQYTWTVDIPPGRYKLAVHVDRAGFQTAGKAFYVVVLPAE